MFADYYATTREELVVGGHVKHITTGGEWTVIRINDDGSIFAHSDLGARRTVKAEDVDRGLATAAYFATL